MNHHLQQFAVVGMATRLPQANSPEAFWQQLINGGTLIQSFSKAELAQHGIAASTLDDPNYIRAKAVIADGDHFAAEFFKYNPRQAQILDPQTRLLIECTWEAWEHAGYNIETLIQPVGVYATTSSQYSYLNHNILPSDPNARSRDYETLINNARDFVATRIAYQFNFTGPSINIQTACSSALVAITYACDDLAAKKCGAAVVGAMSLTFPLLSGYHYQPGMIFSKDGLCRPFDAEASGIVPGNGGGVVIIKRLEDAKRDADTIYAIIDGYAVNNDGKDKLGYTAPRTQAQVELLKQATKAANLQPQDINYIEAHGTGTALGDQIEIAALKTFFHPLTAHEHQCYIGSIKSNLGHLDVAASMAGFIKTVLSLYHRTIPRTVNVTKVNPNFQLEGTPLHVAIENIPLATTDQIAHAGVSALGVGGTNAHVILSSAERPTTSHASSLQILPLSANDTATLEVLKDHLVLSLQQHAMPLADISYTLQVGRKAFSQRQAIICQQHSDAINALYLPNHPNLIKQTTANINMRMVFLIDAGFDNVLDIFTTLYPHNSLFTQAMDECINLLQSIAPEFDAKRLLQPPFDISEQLKPLVGFISSYALAQCWLRWCRCKPVFLGLGLGEYVVSCLTGELSLQESLVLMAIYTREYSADCGQKQLNLLASEMQVQRLMSQIDDGIFGPGFGHRDFARSESVISSVYIQSYNSPNNLSIMLPASKMKAITSALQEQGIVYHEQPHFHPNRQQCQAIIKTLELTLQSMMLKSNSDAVYYGSVLPECRNSNASHLVNAPFATVYYEANIEHIIKLANHCFHSLSSNMQLIRWAQQIQRHLGSKEIAIIANQSTIDSSGYYATLSMQIAQYWVGGFDIDWRAWHCSWSHAHNRKRVALPTYPLTKKSYCIQPKPNAMLTQTPGAAQNLQLPLHHLNWYLDNTTLHAEHPQQVIYVAVAKTPLDQSLLKSIAVKSLKLIPMLPPSATILIDDAVSLEKACQYWAQQLLPHLQSQTTVLFSMPKQLSLQNFYDVIALCKVLALMPVTHRIKLELIQSGVAAILPVDVCNPEAALLLGPALCLQHEQPGFSCRLIDINHNDHPDTTATALLNLLQSEHNKPIIALRAAKRYIPTLNPIEIPDAARNPLRFKHHGVYLITGGLGGIGLAIAEYLATTYSANLLLVSKTPLPEGNWQTLLANGVEAELGEKLLALQRIQKQANQVIIQAVDVASYADMQRFIQQNHNRFGSINGVIHAASAMPEKLIQNRSWENIQAMLAAKVKGLQVLTQILSNKNPDFMLLFSALNSLYGEAGAMDYVAANAYLNGYAQYHDATAYPVKTLVWDACESIGMRSPHRCDNAILYQIGHSQYRPFIIEHVLDDKMILVGTLMLSLAYQYASKTLQQTNLQLKNIAFLRPAVIEELTDFSLYLHHHDKRAELSFSIRQDARHISIAQLSYQPNTVKIDLDIIALLTHFEKLSTLPLAHKNQGKRHRIQVGPHWECLQWVKRDENQFLAAIQLPEAYYAELTALGIHPSLLDVAYSYHAQFMEKLYLPFTIEQITIHAPLGQSFYSNIRITEQNDQLNTCTCQVNLFDSSGQLLISIRNFTLKMLTQLPQSNRTTPATAQDTLSTEDISAYLENALRSAHKMLILSKQRSLQLTHKKMPSSIPEISSHETISSIGHDLKSTLRILWQAELGVAVVNDQDDFTDLGGDSLNAIQLCYQIKAKLGIEINPYSLLSHTIFTTFVDHVQQQLKETA